MYSIYGKIFNSFGYDSSDYFFNKKIRVGKVGNEEIKVQDRFNTKIGYQMIYRYYLLWLNFMEWNEVLICTVELGRIILESKKKHDYLIIVNSV